MTSVSLDSFYSPGTSGEAARFENVGDSIAGTVVDVEMVDDQFHPGTKVLKITVSDEDGGLTAVYLRAPGQKEALGRAVADTGCSAIEVGAELSLTYTGDKPLRNGKSMKVYSATYAPPDSEASPY